MCRACTTLLKKQQNILEDCKILYEGETTTKKKQELFNKYIQVLKNKIIKMEKTMNKLEEIEWRNPTKEEELTL